MIILNNLVYIIGSVYVAFDVALTSQFSIVAKYLFVSSLISNAIWPILILIIVNFVSEDLRLELRELQKHLSLTEVSQDESIEIDGKLIKKANLRLFLMDRMNDFQGFEVGGFAYLGKPFLTSIITNVITYLIVLIQFKVSEIQ